MQTLSLISVNIIESTAMAAKVMISAIYTERSGSSRYFSVFLFHNESIIYDLCLVNIKICNLLKHNKCCARILSFFTIRKNILNNKLCFYIIMYML